MMKILFVENHSTFAETVTSRFLSAYTVVVAPTVLEALSLLGQETFDVALVDYDLDDFKGDAFVRRLREMERTTPVVAVSAHDDGNAALVAAGANAICAKGELAHIGEVLQRIVEKSP